MRASAKYSIGCLLVFALQLHASCYCCLANSSTSVAAPAASPNYDHTSRYDDDEHYRQSSDTRAPGPTSLPTGADNQLGQQPASRRHSGPGASTQTISPVHHSGQPDYDFNDSQHLDGDLLAVETTRLLTVGRQPVVPPYASLLDANRTNNVTPTATTTTSTSLTTNATSVQQLDDAAQNDTRLLRLHPTPPRPIFIRHPLPHGLSSFEHPRSRTMGLNDMSKQLDGYRQQQQSTNFALLPSWPSVYVAQRVSPSFRSAPEANELPNWSLYANNRFVNRTQAAINSTSAGWPDQTHKHTNKLTNVHRLHVDRAPTTSTSLSSAVEYETGAQFARPISWDLDSGRKREKILNKMKTISADNSTDWAHLLHQATENGVVESFMATNHSIVSLLCDTNDMLVRLKFKQPFRGIVSTNLAPHKSCRLFGNGSQYYEMRIALYGCGTRQELPRLFINNIQIQFRDSTTEPIEQVEDELKTIICSYPMRARVHQPPEPNTTPFANDANRSERIVEAPRDDSSNPTPARLVYYEPLLIIAGLLLLAFTLLTLTTGAYLFQRRRLRQRWLGSASTRSSPLGSFTSPRIYSSSPAQLANRMPHVAPPFIGAGKKPTRTATKRPSGRKYANHPTGPWTSFKRKRMPTTYKKQLDYERSEVAQAADKSVSRGGVSIVQVDPHDDNGDSLDSKNNQSSVTTIEIPFVGQEIKSKGISLQPNGNKSSTRADDQPTKSSDPEAKGQQRVRDKFTTETTSAQDCPAPSLKRAKPNRRRSVRRRHQNSRETQTRQSALPFGSFRSKLTSPDEFKRLALVTRMFTDELHDNRPSPAASKYKSKILTTMTELERHQMSELLRNDEVFRSNVVDSTDHETFERKLRDNPKYWHKFRQETWNLLEEILMDPEINNNSTDSSTSFADVNKSRDEVDIIRDNRELLDSEELDTNARGVDNRDNESVVMELDAYRPPVGRLSDNDDSLEEKSPSNGVAICEVSLDNKNIDDQPEIRVRVSQFNSTRTSRVGGTLINIDSITSISSPQNFSAFTRSRIEQRTRYQEDLLDYSLPLMGQKVRSDEFTKKAIRHSAASPSSLNKMASARNYNSNTDTSGNNNKY